MPGRIIKNNGIVVAVGIAVEGLRSSGTLDNGVGGDKPTEDCIVVAGFVEVEAGAVVQFLPGILVGHVGCAGVGERLPIGIVDQIFFFYPTAIGQHTGRAQMIGMEITGGPASHLLDGDALSSPKDHLGAGGALADVKLPDIGGGGCAHGLCDPATSFPSQTIAGSHAAFGHTDAPIFISMGDHQARDCPGNY